jgi:hypothetical protein
MPLNEASAPRSYLTAAQKREALAAIYGVPAPLTTSEIELLREQLAEQETE